MKKECVIMKEEYKGFGTMAIHAGNFEKETFGALSVFKNYGSKRKNIAIAE